MLKVDGKLKAAVLLGITFCIFLNCFFIGCAKKKIVKPVEPVIPITPILEEPSLRGKEYKKTAELETIYFDYDAAALKADARTVLSENVKWLNANPDVEIVIEGHCDERGTTDYNIALGDRRAKSAREYLMKLGIKGNRMATITYGEEKPAAFGHDEDSWSKNRRAELLGRIPPKEAQETE